MAYNYKYITADERKQFITQQNRQFEQTILGHELNFERLKGVPEDTAEQEAVELKSIEVIGAAIAVNEAESAKINTGPTKLAASAKS